MDGITIGSKIYRFTKEYTHCTACDLYGKGCTSICKEYHKLLFGLDGDGVFKLENMEKYESPKGTLTYTK